ncbi:hypothetical protein XYCOK13_02480 [Xylanibacillus composti]|uniref:Uncharacterized protein n=1 Tax=Xylanibacillus composti TaxID=1572762 RepID=A0A8J4GYF0_9BACL|nr:hypothetical protein XYCOK13_02480 [Xylanibacillus composti]
MQAQKKIRSAEPERLRQTLIRDRGRVIGEVYQLWRRPQKKKRRHR